MEGDGEKWGGSVLEVGRGRILEVSLQASFILILSASDLACNNIQKICNKICNKSKTKIDHNGTCGQRM